MVAYRLVLYVCFVVSSSAQLLDMSRGSGGSKHASPMATRSQGSIEDYRGCGGQLSRDVGTPAYLEGSQSLPSPLDSGEHKGTLALRVRQREKVLYYKMSSYLMGLKSVSGV